MLAGERLSSALEIAHVHEVGVHADLFKQALKEGRFSVDARQKDHAALRHHDLIAGGGDQVIGRHRRFHLSVHLLPLGAESLDRVAELVDLRATDLRTLDVEHGAGDRTIIGCLFDPRDGLAQVELHIAEGTRLSHRLG